MERRYAELQIDPQRFLGRFDLNGDGILSQTEADAALATLAHKILRETSFTSALGDAKVPDGTLLNHRYRTLSEIGNGSQGVAYAARDTTNQEIVVVKQLRLSHLETWEAYDGFRREAEVLSTLSHPHLPNFIETFQIENNGKHLYFSVQSLLPGRNLANRIESGELFSEELLYSIADQCLEILTYLHDHIPAVLHRDIKPSNLLLDDLGQLSLVDFGAVQYADATKTMAVGTAGYMAPEQLRGDAKPQSDLYSLGATLIRLATRRHPHDFELKRMRLDWRSYSSLSDGFSDWIDKLIDPEFEDRFQNAETASVFLKGKKSVFLRREANNDMLTSLELVEQFSNKPAGCEVRIWESVDQFVCTFPKVDPAKFKDPDSTSIMQMFENLFTGSRYKRLTTGGGGFSFDAKANCTTAPNDTFYAGQIDNIRSRRFQNGDLGLTTHYGGESATRQVLIVGLNDAELNWVWNMVENFFVSHNRKNIMQAGR